MDHGWTGAARHHPAAVLGLGPLSIPAGPLYAPFPPLPFRQLLPLQPSAFFWMGPRQDHKDTMPPSPPRFLLQNPCFNANLKYRRRGRDLSFSPSVSSPPTNSPDRPSISLRETLTAQVICHRSLKHGMYDRCSRRSGKCWFLRRAVPEGCFGETTRKGMSPVTRQGVSTHSGDLPISPNTLLQHGLHTGRAFNVRVRGHSNIGIVTNTFVDAKN